MRILVTGGAGFIGSHTVDALLEKGHQIKILDNLQKPVHLKGKPSYIPEETEFIYGDVRDKSTLKYALEGVDAVYHFAAYQDYLPDFSTYFHVNSVSTALIYEIIVEEKLPIKKVIVASSQAVLGEGLYECSKCKIKNKKNAKHQIPKGTKRLANNQKNGWLYQPDIRIEEQLSRGEWEHRCPVCGETLQYLQTPEEKVNPQNQYAMSKYSQEMIAINLGKRYDIPTVALRYSIVQGPRQSFYNAYSGAMRIFALSLYFNKSPLIFEDGNQVRDYINIQDVVNANLLVLDNERANYQTFNVGGGKPYTVLEFYSKMQEVVNRRQEPILGNFYRYGDTRHIFSDISKLRSLGWEPKVSIEKSIVDYWEYLNQQTDVEDILSFAERRMKQLDVIRKVKHEEQ